MKIILNTTYLAADSTSKSLSTIRNLMPKMDTTSESKTKLQKKLHETDIIG